MQGMAAGGNPLHAAHPQLLQRTRAVAAEHMGREHGFHRQPGQRNVRRVQHREIGLLAHGQTRHRAARCLRPALHGREPHGGAHLGLRRAGQHIALAQRQALAVLQHHQFLGRIHAGMAVGAHAPGTAMRLPQRHVEDAVAQVGLGGGADAGHRAGARRIRILLRRHVRGMHQAPAGVHAGMLQQPLHGALAAPGQAVVHLLGLLCDVDVNGGLGIDGGEALHGSSQAVGRHGTQRVWRQAQARALGLGQGRQAL